MTTQRLQKTPASDGKALPKQRRWSWLGVAVCLLPLGLGCGASGLPEGDSFKLAEVTWNGKMMDFGKISAVAEIYDDTLILADSGAVVLTSGVPLAMDTTVKSWSRAAVLPAADLSGSWAVGIDGSGALRRLKNRSVMEDISDRYGLSGTPVTELAPMGEVGAAFALGSQLAVADGQTVVRLDGALSMLAGAPGRVAGVLDGKLRLIETSGPTAHDFELGSLTSVLFDENNHLVVSTSDALYTESTPGVLQKIHTSAGEPIHEVARSGKTLWLHLGDSLAMVQAGKLRRAVEGDPNGMLPAAARLYGSPSGDVWTLNSGALRLLAEDNGGGADEDLWRRNAQPIFTRLCAACHLPGGSSGINLSTYQTWVAKRATIAQRVFDGKPTPMPPAGAGTLTADERAALQVWTGKNQYNGSRTAAHRAGLAERAASSWAPRAVEL